MKNTDAFAAALNNAYCTHVHNMQQKEAAIPQFLLRTLAAARPVVTSATGQTLAGAAGGAAVAPLEEKIIEGVTGSEDLHPGAKIALYASSIGRGAMMGNPYTRKHSLFGTKDLKHPVTGQVVGSVPRTFRNFTLAGHAVGLPMVGSAAIHKVMPTKPMSETGTAAEAVNLIDKGPMKALSEAMADAFTKKMLPKELADIYNDPSLRDANGGLDMAKAIPVMQQNESALRKTELWPIYKAVMNPQDLAKDIGTTVADKVSDTIKTEGKDALRTFAPDFMRSLGVSAGLGLVGSGAGWFAGSAAGNALFPDRPNKSFAERLSAHRRRAAMKILLSTVGGAGLMYMAGQHGGNAVQAVENMGASLNKLRDKAAPPKGK